MPRSTDLPDDLKQLVRRNALQVGDTHFDDDCRRLVAAIEQVLEKAAAERREHEEKEPLEHEPQSQPPSPVTSVAPPPAKPEADKPYVETPKVVYPPQKPAEPEREKPLSSSSGGTGGKRPSKQVIVFLPIAAVLVVGGLIYLAIRPSPSPPPPPASASASPSQVVIATPTPAPTRSSFPSATRVFASGDRQLEFLKKNFSKLSSAGITATLREKPLSDKSRPPDTNEIRYFHPEDKQDALRIAQAVRDAFGVDVPDPKFYGDDQASHGYIEI